MGGALAIGAASRAARHAPRSCSCRAAAVVKQWRRMGSDSDAHPRASHPHTATALAPTSRSELHSSESAAARAARSGDNESWAPAAASAALASAVGDRRCRRSARLAAATAVILLAPLLAPWHAISSVVVGCSALIAAVHSPGIASAVTSFAIASQVMSRTTADTEVAVSALRMGRNTCRTAASRRSNVTPSASTSATRKSTRVMMSSLS